MVVAEFRAPSWLCDQESSRARAPQPACREALYQPLHRARLVELLEDSALVAGINTLRWAARDTTRAILYVLSVSTRRLLPATIAHRDGARMSRDIRRHIRAPLGTGSNGGKPAFPPSGRGGKRRFSLFSSVGSPNAVAAGASTCLRLLAGRLKVRPNLAVLVLRGAQRRVANGTENRALLSSAWVMRRRWRRMRSSRNAFPIRLRGTDRYILFA